MAGQIEAACRTALAKGEMGIKPKRQIPSLEDFVLRLREEIRKKSAEHPRKAAFYEDAFNRALRFQPLAKAIFSTSTQSFSLASQVRELNEVALATVNQSLSAVRRALYVAYDWKTD